MRCVGTDRLDEVRDEVCAALQLDVDVRPARVDLVAEPDEAVVAEGEERDGYRRDAEEDPEPEHAPSVER